jgi:hypothetical protein
MPEGQEIPSTAQSANIPRITNASVQAIGQRCRAARPPHIKESGNQGLASFIGLRKTNN